MITHPTKLDLRTPLAQIVQAVSLHVPGVSRSSSLEPVVIHKILLHDLHAFVAMNYCRADRNVQKPHPHAAILQLNPGDNNWN